MARVTLVEKEQAHPMVKDLFEKNIAKSGEVLNLYKALGHCPFIGLNFQRLGNSLLKGEALSPKLRELAVIRVGNLAGSIYEFTKHTAVGLRCGVTQQQIDSIGNWQNSPRFDDVEKAVLAYTDEVALNVEVKDTTFQQLRSYLNEHEIVELTVVIGYYGMACRVLVALQVELES